MKTREIVLMLTLVLFGRAVLAATEPTGTELNLKVINQFIKENPHDPNLYFVKGQFLYEQRKFKKAAMAYETVLSIYPNYTEAHFELARTHMNQRNYDQALNHINKYLLNNPDDVSGLLIKSEIFLVFGDFEKSTSLSDAILNLDKFNGKAFLLKGEVEYEIGNFDAARENWQKANELGEVEGGLHLKYLLKPVW